MFFQILREFGAPAPNIFYNYSDDEESTDDESDDGTASGNADATAHKPAARAKQPALDPVNCAGCTNRRALHSAALASGWETFVAATSILFVPGEFERRVLREMPPKWGIGRQTRSWMLMTVLLLSTFNIVEEVTQREGFVLFCALFCVAKNAEQLRLIFDGRTLNELCHTPPPISLPSIVEVLARANAARLVISGDLRHYFHQLSTPSQVGRFLGVKCGKKFFKYKTLPMGLSWSPHIAQSISFLLLTHREKGAKNFFDTDAFMQGQRLPKEVTVLKDGVPVGFAVIVYDNFGIFLDIDDKKFAKEIADRLIANARHFNIKWKELQILAATATLWIVKDEITQSKETREWVPYDKKKPPHFLGVELDLSAESSSMTVMMTLTRNSVKRRKSMTKALRHF